MLATRSTRVPSVGVPPAPITANQRNALRRNLANLTATAGRRGTTLSEWDRRVEERAGQTHFEVGAWGWWSQQRRRELSVDERARVVFAVLASGKTDIGYEFFTAFDFGERAFDAFFEMGDGDEVVQAVSDRVLASQHSVALAGLRANGWERPARQHALVF